MYYPIIIVKCNDLSSVLLMAEKIDAGGNLGILQDGLSFSADILLIINPERF